eukprot:TRINITY_DN19881_c0_g1_i1.p5 TRINITY_DN19881_c0_g1~~TRINITY_DN19881_c0_g1_i1.p5  ORF type:complete len:215 (+),score=52.08 TRINITY_DN19881_c0_g1_i1:78-647(+)
MPRHAAERRSPLALLAAASRAGPRTALLLRAAGEPGTPVCGVCGWGQQWQTAASDCRALCTARCARCARWGCGSAAAGAMLCAHINDVLRRRRQQQQQQQRQRRAAGPADLELPDNFVLCSTRTPPQGAGLPPRPPRQQPPPQPGPALPAAPAARAPPPRRLGAAWCFKLAAATCALGGITCVAARARR